MNKILPIDPGMVSFIKALEEKDEITAKRLFVLYLQAGDDDVILRNTDYLGNIRCQISIHDRGNKKNQTLAGYVHTENCLIGYGGISISLDSIPQSILARLTETDSVFIAKELIEHPYLDGAYAHRGSIDPNKKYVMLKLKRDKPRHGLTAQGIIDL